MRRANTALLPLSSRVTSSLIVSRSAVATGGESSVAWVASMLPTCAASHISSGVADVSGSTLPRNAPQCAHQPGTTQDALCRASVRPQSGQTWTSLIR